MNATRIVFYQDGNRGRVHPLDLEMILAFFGLIDSHAGKNINAIGDNASHSRLARAMETQRRRNIWLCVLTDENFRIAKEARLYGVPKSKRALHQIAKAKPGDILVFYLKSPIQKIVEIYEVTSRMFETTEMAPWEDRLYPYRVRITFKRECSVPYERFLKPRISKGGSMISMTEENLREIMSLCGTQ